IVWLAGFFVWRGRPDILGLGDLNSPVYQYRQAIEKAVGTCLTGLPLIIGLISGFMLQGSWRTILLFVSGTDFGETDPQFGLDYGFYAFQLPVFQMIVSTLSMLTLVALLIALVGHYVLGGIRIGNQAAG